MMIQIDDRHRLRTKDAMNMELFELRERRDGTNQAIERIGKLADLIDRETCHLVEDEEGRTACSECGCTALYMLDASYCPDCGAEVAE